MKALEITIVNQKSILPLKTILSQKTATNQQDAITIFLIADGKKILLPQKYQLNTTDIFRLQNIPAGVVIKKLHNGKNLNYQHKFHRFTSTFTK